MKLQAFLWPDSKDFIEIITIHGTFRIHTVQSQNRHYLVKKGVELGWTGFSHIKKMDEVHANKWVRKWLINAERDLDRKAQEIKHLQRQEVILSNILRGDT